MVLTYSWLLAVLAFLRCDAISTPPDSDISNRIKSIWFLNQKLAHPYDMAINPIEIPSGDISPILRLNPILLDQFRLSGLRQSSETVAPNPIFSDRYLYFNLPFARRRNYFSLPEVDFQNTFRSAWLNNIPAANPNYTSLSNRAFLMDYPTYGYTVNMRSPTVTPAGNRITMTWLRTEDPMVTNYFPRFGSALRNLNYYDQDNDDLQSYGKPLGTPSDKFNSFQSNWYQKLIGFNNGNTGNLYSVNRGDNDYGTFTGPFRTFSSRPAFGWYRT